MIFFQEEIDRFMSHVVKINNCWFWIGWIDKDGYGKVRINGKNYMAHRVSYAMRHKDFDPATSFNSDLTLDHICKDKACVRPSHLREISRLENSGANKTHCKNGHELTEENTGWQMSNKGREIRYCRICKRQREHKSRSGTK